MAALKWSDVVERCDRAGLSRAEMARRAGISESTVVKGLKRDSRPTGAVRRQIELVLALEEQVQKDEAVGSRQSAVGDSARAKP